MPPLDWVVVENAIHTTGLAAFYLLRAALALIAAVGAGSIWPRVSRERLGPVLAVAVCAVLGFGWIATAMLVLGLAGVLKPVPVVLVALACVARGVPVIWSAFMSFRRAGGENAADGIGRPGLGRFHVLLIVLSGLCALNVLLGALAPDSSQDALWYHLACARAWIEWGSVLSWPAVYPSSFLLHGSLLYSFLLSAGDGIDCSLLYAFEGFLALLVAAGFAARWFGIRAAVWAWFLGATAFATNVWFVPINTGSDLTVAMFATAGLLLGMDALFIPGAGPGAARHRHWHLFAASLLVGFSVASKMTALGYALAPWWAICGYVVLERRLRPGRTPEASAPANGAVILACVVGMLPLVFWAARNLWLGCGSPVFPLFRDMLPIKPEYALTARNSSVNTLFPLTPAGFLAALGHFPLKMEYACSGRSPGFVLHAAVIACLFVPNRLARAFGALAAIQWVAYFWTLGTNETVKYLAMCYPAAFVMAAAGLARFEESRIVSRPVKALSLAALVLILAGAYAWKQYDWGSYSTVAWGYRPVLTPDDRRAYLITKEYELASLPLYEWINANTPRESVVLFADSAFPFYVKRRYLWSDEDLHRFALLREQGVVDRMDALLWLQDRKIDFVVAHPSSVEKHPGWRDALERVRTPGVSVPLALYKPVRPAR